MLIIPKAARIARLQRAYRRAQAAHPREDMPSADQLRNLGLLDKAEETERVLASVAAGRGKGNGA
jgi:NADH dehydrogenase (ubiquinone) Fe-S protein 5